LGNIFLLGLKQISPLSGSSVIGVEDTKKLEKAKEVLIPLYEGWKAYAERNQNL